MRDNSRRRIKIVIIGSYPDRIKGSLLRQLNIWYSIRDLESFNVMYIHLTKESVHRMRDLIFSDIVILSGTASSIYSLLLLFIRKILRKPSIVDFHGIGWYEDSIAHEGNKLKQVLRRSLTFTYEFLAYKTADHVVAASHLLSFILKRYFKPRKNLHVIENSVTPLFEKIVKRLRDLDPSLLRRHLHDVLKIPHNSYVLLCPLPENFASNKLAIDALSNIEKSLDEKVCIIVTGVKSRNEKGVGRVIYAGYLSYVEYVALIMISSGVLLPYPPNAICGGVRNKVLEAGYCGKILFSTRTGVLFTKAQPKVHYYPIDDLLSDSNDKITISVDLLTKKELDCMAEEFKSYIDSRHLFTEFKSNLLKLLAKILSRTQYLAT
ncbi:MAG: hypothetical protein QXN90_06490 [Zestosphaera sp.]